MMTYATVAEYPLEYQFQQFIELPKDAKVIGVQGGRIPCLYVMQPVESTEVKKVRIVILLGHQQMEENPHLHYVGTFIRAETAYHVFGEEISEN